MKNLGKLKKVFNRIKKLGFVKCTRPNNTDGGIGNTFEDLLGVAKNNKKEADFKVFEVKSKRLFNSSFVSLFTNRLITINELILIYVKILGKFAMKAIPTRKNCMHQFLDIDHQ